MHLQGQSGKTYNEGVFVRAGDLGDANFVHLEQSQLDFGLFFQVELLVQFGKQPRLLLPTVTVTQTLHLQDILLVELSAFLLNRAVLGGLILREVEQTLLEEKRFNVLDRLVPNCLLHVADLLLFLTEVELDLSWSGLRLLVSESQVTHVTATPSEHFAVFRECERERLGCDYVAD